MVKPLCTLCGKYPQSSRKGVCAGQCCNKCPEHGPWCTKHDLDSDSPKIAEESKAIAKGKKRSAESVGTEGKKRSGESVAGTSKKRVTAKCEDVVGGITKVDTLSPSCREMLSAMARSSLVTYAADRHPYQTQAVDILKEALTGMKKQMQDSIVQAQAKVDNADQESELRSSTLEQAKAALEDLSQKTMAAKDALKDDKATLGLTKASQSTAEAALESIDAEAASMGEKREMLEAALKEMYEPLKVSKASGAEGRKAVSTLVKIFRDVGFEGGFVDLVPETFRKDPEERGTFDRLLEEHVQRHSAKFIAEAEAAIKATEVRKAELMNVKAAAEVKHIAAAEKLSASSAALQTAKSAQEEGKAVLKAAQEAVTGFEREVATTRRSLGEMKSTLESFTQGPLQSLAELENLAPEPPAESSSRAPAPEPAEEEEVEEPGTVVC